MSLAARIPKVHLHCHLEGTLRAATFVELAGKYGVPLRYRPSEGSTAWVGEPLAVDPNEPYRFADFQEFLLTFAAASRSLAQPGDYARLAREFVEDALAQNVMYGELFISPSVWTFFNPKLDVREAVTAIAGELRAAKPRATFRLIADLTRNFGAQRAMKTAQLAASMIDVDVIGVGLGGDETRFPAADFAQPFAYARSRGLQCVAHAGEAAGAHSVADAIELLGAQRIGHGIAALQDARVVDMLVSKGIALEICPTSNRLTGVALPDSHAHLEFDRVGCTVTIDADDPAMFGTSIAREYAIAEETAGSDALLRYVRNAIDASFADAELKRDLHARVTQATDATELSDARRRQDEHVGP
ncbi:MAG TPA: adenosine deaminase [Candidatus Baltobacteraceae bacterium]|nr:adenosine deaminase [Candidatus Baltobacteraceae bacterium]